MIKLSKRIQQADKVFDNKKSYTLNDAVEIVEKFPKTKFDETVELHFHLAIDIKASDQLVRGTVSLPHGIGKKVRVAVFCKGEVVQKAQDAGADHVGGQDLIDKVAGGFMDFDVTVATPDIMRELSKLGKVLGPRGLMPTPKAGTVTLDVEKAIKELKAGKIEFKSDKQAGIHVGVGKRSFPKNKLVDNANEVINAINNAKPASVKVALVKSVYLSTTMGRGVKIAI